MKKTESLCIGTRLNPKQKKEFDLLAKEKGMSTSLLLKQVILDYLEDETKKITDFDILNTLFLEQKKKIEQLSVSQEYFTQLFNFWLNTWFMSHPKINDETYKEKMNMAIKRKDDFINLFNEKGYDENKTLFQINFMNEIEEG